MGNPVFMPASQPENPVKVYDMLQTLADTQPPMYKFMEDRYEDYGKSYFTSKKALEVISNDLYYRMKYHELPVMLFRGVYNHLAGEKAAGTEIHIYSNAPNFLAQIMAQQTEIDPLITGYISSYDDFYKDYGILGKKDRRTFIDLYNRFESQGKHFTCYFDDSITGIIEAQSASDSLSKQGKTGIKAYLVKADATESELGTTKYGFIVIRSIDEEGKYDIKVSGYTDEKAEKGLGEPGKGNPGKKPGNKTDKKSSKGGDSDKEGSGDSDGEDSEGEGEGGEGDEGCAEAA